MTQSKSETVTRSSSSCRGTGIARKRILAANLALVLTVVLLAGPLAAQQLIRPGHPDWPRGWASYRTVESLEKDQDCGKSC